VSQVVFADRADGWLYDQYNSRHIWVTHNGGASWREITLPGNIATMAVSARAVYAVAGNQPYSSPLGWNAWMRVNARTRYGPMTGSTLAVSGNSVWFGSSTYLWTTADGVHWARYSFHCPAPIYGEPYSLAGISAANRSDVAFLYAAAPAARAHPRRGSPLPRPGAARGSQSDAGGCPGQRGHQHIR
jgi:hypothetical protein